MVRSISIKSKFEWELKSDMFQPKFEPNVIELDGDYIIFDFIKGDIEVMLKQESFFLLNTTRMQVQIHNARVMNDDQFVFESESGKRISYDARQIKSLNGIKQLIEGIIDNKVDRENYILVSASTELIISEIMEYHKEILINKYLDEGNFEALSKIVSSAAQ